MRTVAARGATGTPAPTTTTPTTSVPPAMLVEAVSLCRGLAPFAILGRVAGFEPFTRYAFRLHVTFTDGTETNFGGSGWGFTTDGAGASEVFDLGNLVGADRPFTVFIAIWPDPNDNQVQDPAEPTVFSGSFVNDLPCKEGAFVPD